MKRRPARQQPPRSSRRPWVAAGLCLTGVVLLVLVQARTRSGNTPTSAAAAAQDPGPPVYGYRVVHVYPHDPGAFTQGLVYRDGFLFESTGLQGRSTLRQVKLETGEVVQQRMIEPQHFAEGLSDWGDTLLQLTWQSQVGFRYDLVSFAPMGTFSYAGEGWGLTHDDTRLIMSDGSATLRFLDPSAQRELGRLTVRDRGEPVYNLNELEFVKGEVYANVWQSDRIARIDPQSGRLTGWIDLAGLPPGSDRTAPVDVLNGIAYDAARDRLFVTGKWWPRLYEIRIERGP